MQSVGGSSQQEGSVNSVDSVGILMFSHRFHRSAQNFLLSVFSHRFHRFTQNCLLSVFPHRFHRFTQKLGCLQGGALETGALLKLAGSVNSAYSVGDP